MATQGSRDNKRVSVYWELENGKLHMSFQMEALLKKLSSLKELKQKFFVFTQQRSS